MRKTKNFGEGFIRSINRKVLIGEVYFINVLTTREELIAMGYPFGRVNDNIPFGYPSNEWMRSNPDVKVYIPQKRGYLVCNDESDH